MSGLVDARGNPVILGGRVVLGIVLEGNKLNFGANSEIIHQLTREAKMKILEAVKILIFEGEHAGEN